MTDGIGRIFGGNNYGVGGYMPNRSGEEAPQDAAQKAPAQNYTKAPEAPALTPDTQTIRQKTDKTLVSSVCYFLFQFFRPLLVVDFSF